MAKKQTATSKLKTKRTPIHPVDILLSLCKGLASVGSSAGDSTARGSSMALGSLAESKGKTMPTFSRGGEKEGDEENSSSTSSPPPFPGVLGPRRSLLSVA